MFVPVVDPNCFKIATQPSLILYILAVTIRLLDSCSGLAEKLVRERAVLHDFMVVSLKCVWNSLTYVRCFLDKRQI